MRRLTASALALSCMMTYAQAAGFTPRNIQVAAGGTVCLNCPPNSNVCYPNTCDASGCHVSGQACSITGGNATGCPNLPFCPSR